jgi:hypothetical protein
MALTYTPGVAAAEHKPKRSGPTDLVLTARVELYACLQLLAARARFVTGATWAAIALHEGSKFIYRAAVGEHAPEIGGEANLKPGDALELHPNVQARGKFLVARVAGNGKTEGVFQLVSGRAEFSQDEIDSIVRLAEMVSTALEHMHAAEHSEEVILTAASERLQREIARSWHAPEGPEVSTYRNSKSVEPHVPASVRTCEGCGFPVSHGRNICVDCEERGGARSSRLFTPEAHESWINAHGYTVASLLVSALAAAILYWLR